MTMHAQSVYGLERKGLLPHVGQYRLISHLCAEDDHMVARCRLPPAGLSATHRRTLVTDALFQLMAVAGHRQYPGHTCTPMGCASVEWTAPIPRRGSCHIRACAKSSATAALQTKSSAITGDVEAVVDGVVVVRARNVRMVAEPITAPSNHTRGVLVVGQAMHFAGDADGHRALAAVCLRDSCQCAELTAQELGVLSVPRNMISNSTYGACQTTAGTPAEWLRDVAKQALGGVDAARCGLVVGSLSFPSAKSQLAYDAILASNLEGCVDSRRLPRAVEPATLVQRELALGGPCYSIDAACASSLHAMWLAMGHILRGEADYMLCGGVALPERAFVLTGFSKFQALPPQGEPSRPLHSDSKGMTPGDGCGLLLLCRDDIACHPAALARLLGVAVGNGGRGTPLRPDAERQGEFLTQTYRDLGIDPATVGFVECHATGTPLGDQAELDAMRACFERVPPHASVKTHVGHALVAANAASVSLAMHRLQLRTPADGVRWPVGCPRRVAVSGFGFGATNAHAVLEAVPRAPPSVLSPYAMPLPLRPVALHVMGMGATRGGADDLRQVAQALRSRPGDQNDGLPGNPQRERIETVYSNHRRLGPGGQSKLTEDRLQPQHLLGLKTFDEALRDASSQRPLGKRVGVLVTLTTPTCFETRSRLVAPFLAPGACGATELPDVSASSYTSLIGNVLATRVAAQWGFRGPAMTVSEGAHGGFRRAVELAQHWLVSNIVDAVAVGAVDLQATHNLQVGIPGGVDGAAALVLVRADLGAGYAALTLHPQDVNARHADGGVAAPALDVVEAVLQVYHRWCPGTGLHWHSSHRQIPTQWGVTLTGNSATPPPVCCEDVEPADARYCTTTTIPGRVPQNTTMAARLRESIELRTTN